MRETTGQWLNYQLCKTHFSCNLQLVTEYPLNVTLSLNLFQYQNKQVTVIFGQMLLLEKWMKKEILAVSKTWHTLKDILAPEYDFLKCHSLDF